MQKIDNILKCPNKNNNEIPWDRQTSFHFHINKRFHGAFWKLCFLKEMFVKMNQFEWWWKLISTRLFISYKQYENLYLNISSESLWNLSEFGLSNSGQKSTWVTKVLRRMVMSCFSNHHLDARGGTWGTGAMLFLQSVILPSPRWWNKFKSLTQL